MEFHHLNFVVILSLKGESALHLCSAESMEINKIYWRYIITDLLSPWMGCVITKFKCGKTKDF
jgi:hypothetical protein